MTHRIDVLKIAYAIEEADVEDVQIDRAFPCETVGKTEVCAALQAEDHVSAIKVLVALGGTEYEEARLLTDQLHIVGRAHGVTFYFPGVQFDGALTTFDEGVEA